jgi:hypothetical protein
MRRCGCLRLLPARANRRRPTAAVATAAPAERKTVRRLTGFMSWLPRAIWSDPCGQTIVIGPCAEGHWRVILPPGLKARVWMRRVQRPEQSAEKLVMGRETILRGLKPSIFLATFAAVGDESPTHRSCPEARPSGVGSCYPRSPKARDRGHPVFCGLRRQRKAKAGPSAPLKNASLGMTRRGEGAVCGSQSSFSAACEASAPSVPSAFRRPLTISTGFVLYQFRKIRFSTW